MRKIREGRGGGGGGGEREREKLRSANIFMTSAITIFPSSF